MHPSFVRQYHASRLFHALLAQPGLTMRRLGDVTGCDRSTVSVILKRFEGIGLVERVAGETSGKRGRPSEIFRISKSSGLLIGVHLEFEVMVIVVAGLDGERFGRLELPLPSRPADFAGDLRQGIMTICEAHGRSVNEVRGVGISLPGLVGPSGGLAQSSNLSWYEVAVPDMLRSAIGAPVYVDNDTNAATLAESLFGACSHLSEFVMIAGGLGLGGGIFVDGSLYRGSGGYGGEFGHIKVVRDGRTCGCGASGCLSAYVAAPALIARARQAASVQSVDEIIALADAGHDEVRRVLAEAGRFLGLAMADLINIFNPPAIVLGGIVARIWPYAEAEARHAMRENAMQSAHAMVDVIVSTLSLQPMPAGGVALALEGFTSLDGQEPSPW